MTAAGMTEKKEGYEEVSAEYEHKLIEQADLFLKQTRCLKRKEMNMKAVG